MLGRISGRLIRSMRAVVALAVAISTSASRGIAIFLRRLLFAVPDTLEVAAAVSREEAIEYCYRPTLLILQEQEQSKYP